MTEWLTSALNCKVPDVAPSVAATPGYIDKVKFLQGPAAAVQKASYDLIQGQAVGLTLLISAQSIYSVLNCLVL